MCFSRLIGLLLLTLALVACEGQASVEPVEATQALATISPTRDPLPTPQPYRLRPGDLVLASSPDDIPAILANDSLFVGADEGDEEWEDEELVVGVALGGQARAYPIRLLSLHEVVNDTVGGQPIVVTWCPLCYTALVFDRNVGGQELTFGVSGFLFRNNLVMYDHQSETLWSQALAQGIRGAFDRNMLDFVPYQLTTWGNWKDLHSSTQVLSARQLGKQADEVVDPYVSYYTSSAPGLGRQESVDDRLAPKELVLGLRLGAEQRAYPFVIIRELGLVNDELGGVAVLLVYNPALNSAAAFSRSLESQNLVFELDDAGLIRDGGTGSRWDPTSGQAVEGPLQGAQLARLTAPIIFWFAWADIHPETDLFSAE